MQRKRSRPSGGFLTSAVLLPLALLASSCAYYNTYYMARKYYDRATGRLPYAVEQTDPATVANYDRAIEYAKKVIANYPKDKWADDAYLMWARALLGKDDPLETVNMLRDFPSRYPKSSLKNEAVFYLGVGAKKARKYTEALEALDEFLKRAPSSSLAPYAHLERASAMRALERPGEAAAAASQVIERFPKSKLRDRALNARAEALLVHGDHARARQDFRALGTRARTDEERFGYLLKEADCLEAARDYGGELGLLRDALSHELEPSVADSGRATTYAAPTSSGQRYARLLLKIGTVHLLEGRRDDALSAYRHVISSFPRTLLGAEAQYRVAYLYETLADDFERARVEYGRVKDVFPASPFATQAAERLVSLERLAQYRGAGVDSVGKKVEAGFMLAELYLFQLEKPDRAIQEYRMIARAHAGTPYAAKAMNAEAWVLRHRFDRASEADSVLWAVVHQYPATEAQLDARDYLEFAGKVVPPELIKLPERLLARSDPAPPLTQPPPSPRLGNAVVSTPDSLARLGPARLRELMKNTQPTVLIPPRVSPLDDPPRLGPPPAAARSSPDSVDRRARLANPRPAPPDSGGARP
ncbi:MAG TPA: tetratricopeptide repeat protein [Candidatus Eisenbacteria bacterium]|jgi:TolA-binding protein